MSDHSPSVSVSDARVKPGIRPIALATGDLAPGVVLLGPRDDRRAAEDFIRAIFRRHYGARVKRFKPYLLVVQDPLGRPLAALGFRIAGEQPLFIEQYLATPLEQAIATATGRSVVRNSIVEVGNLAVASAGGARRLIVILTTLLYRHGLDWVAFTAVPRLRNAFLRLGLLPVDLGPATLQALPAADRPLWGSFYAQKPRVLAGSVAYGYHALSDTRDPTIRRQVARFLAELAPTPEPR